jgi:uncharacterized protein (DUF2062 family)
MPRKFIKRYIPSEEKIAKNKFLRLLGPWLFNPQLWHLHRRNMAKAATIGLFLAFMPIPTQMLFAAIAAIIIRANLPVSLALCWVSNPVTIPPMLYLIYKVGEWVLGAPVHAQKFAFTLQWLSAEISHIWKPLFLGAFICGTTAAILGNITVRVVWRWWVIRHWRLRQQKRKSAGLS